MKPDIDHGPIARWAAIRESDPTLLGVIMQRLADGETVRAIASAWQVPRRAVAEYVRDHGRKLCGFVEAKKKPSARVVSILTAARSKALHFTEPPSSPAKSSPDDAGII